MTAKMSKHHLEILGIKSLLDSTYLLGKELSRCQYIQVHFVPQFLLSKGRLEHVSCFWDSNCHLILCSGTRRRSTPNAANEMSVEQEDFKTIMKVRQCKIKTKVWPSICGYRVKQFPFLTHYSFKKTQSY